MTRHDDGDDGGWRFSPVFDQLGCAFRSPQCHHGDSAKIAVVIKLTLAKKVRKSTLESLMTRRKKEGINEQV